MNDNFLITKTFKDSNIIFSYFSHQFRIQGHQEQDYGPATAPYPPPVAGSSSSGYASADDLLANR